MDNLVIYTRKIKYNTQEANMKESSQLNASFQLILEVTTLLIEEKGCRLTTMQDIIDRSGLSKGAIYHYVSSKDELFGLILKFRMELLNAKFFEEVSKSDAREINPPLQVIVEGIFDHSEHQNVTNKIFIYLLGRMESQKVEEIVREIYVYTLDTSRKWIEVGQQKGVIPAAIDAEKMALIFITFMYGLRVQKTIIQGEGKMDVTDIFQVIFRSLQ